MTVKEVKVIPLRSTQEERDAFDEMFWNSVDLTEHPEHGVQDNVDHVPERTDDGSGGEDISPEPDQVLQPKEETEIERLTREMKEKYA